MIDRVGINFVIRVLLCWWDKSRVVRPMCLARELEMINENNEKKKNQILYSKKSYSQDWGEDSKVDDDDYHTEEEEEEEEDSDLSEEEDDEEDDKIKTEKKKKKKERDNKVKSLKSVKSLSPNSSPITRRLSMRIPSSAHIFHNPEINEIDNGQFLEQLLKEISTFPDPPVRNIKPENSHPTITPISSSTNEEINNPKRKVTARWAMVTNFAKKLASTNENSNSSSAAEGGTKTKFKIRRQTKTIPNVSEDQYV